MTDGFGTEAGGAFWISLKISLSAVLLNLPLAIGIGYLLARSRSAYKALLETIVYLPLVLPPVVTGYLLLIAFSRHGWLGAFLQETLGIRITFTWLGAALAAAVVSFPLTVKSIRQAFQSIDPRLELAARSLGAGSIDTFFTISLPLAMRGIIGGSVLGFARCLGEFGATIMVAGNIPQETQTIPLAIYSMTQRPNGIEQTWSLVCLSVALAFLALSISEYLEKDRNRGNF